MYLKHADEYKLRAQLHRIVRNKQMKETDLTSEYLRNKRKEVTNCPLCGCELTNKNNNPNQYNLDHIIPLCVGGKHFKRNVRYICRTCNLSRRLDGSDLLEDTTVSKEIKDEYIKINQ